MKIVIGSTNPVKLKATEEAINIIKQNEKWPNGVIFESLSIKIPELNNTPHSIDEMLEGATIRSRKSLNQTNADYGIGIEGGVYSNRLGTFLTAYVVVSDKRGNIGIGSAPNLKVPSSWKLGSDKAFELGTYVDKLTGETNIKQKKGAMGYLTKDLITRQESLKIGVICAYYSLQNELT